MELDGVVTTCEMGVGGVFCPLCVCVRVRVCFELVSACDASCAYMRMCVSLTLVSELCVL